MRILYDHQVFSLQNVGGASTYFYELASHLSRLPSESVSLYLGLQRSVQPFWSLKQYGARVMEWDSNMRPGLARYAVNEAVTSALCLAIGRFDIYHATLYRRMPMARARRLVATNHDCTHETFPDLFPDAQRVIEAKERLYDSADAIICVSESSRLDLIKFYNPDPAKIHVISLGLPRLRRDAIASQEFVASLRRPYLLFVGARHTYKNFGGLLKAFAHGGFVEDYDLVVIGGGKFSDRELDEIRSFGLSSAVIHWDFVSEPILAEAYARARLFVSPSLYEGFGLPPLEAMSLGCPVLASNSSSSPEVCGEAAFYFDPLCDGDLERGLCDALNDRDGQRRREIGTERAASFRWQTMAEETMAVYRGL